MGQRSVKKPYLRVFQVSSPCRPLLRGFKDDGEARQERTFPPVDSRSVENVGMLLRRGQKAHIK